MDSKSDEKGVQPDSKRESKESNFTNCEAKAAGKADVKQHLLQRVRDYCETDLSFHSAFGIKNSTSQFALIVRCADEFIREHAIKFMLAANNPADMT